ncbi:TPA: PTS system mannose/fructose/N-acetylgalactosamine-transporter subunit IIB [Photobacterium damselae]|uniref:PTS system mannose/fructose/N-acetylgalactosamine-transporter subunit IIB n=1 Tax=Photobacterium damselae TaxID=38293 RepID=UPI0020906477|nr:PTS sugar transporter subunit IIB [Photobacterium damselae]USR75303.1 PTS sugar transporter subunit IIB [Photobacterium damselae]
MANIVLARIDERLIHGQIRLQWGKHSGANTILVANDEIAQLEPLQAPFKASAGSDFAVLFRTIDQTIANLPKAGMDRKILLLCKNPTDFAKIVQGGIKLPEINIGNMHFHEGRVVVNKYINVDKRDMAAFNILREHGSISTIQHMPESNKECIFEMTKDLQI